MIAAHSQTFIIKIYSLTTHQMMSAKQLKNSSIENNKPFNKLKYKQAAEKKYKMLYNRSSGEIYLVK